METSVAFIMDLDRGRAGLGHGLASGEGGKIQTNVLLKLVEIFGFFHYPSHYRVKLCVP